MALSDYQVPKNQEVTREMSSNHQNSMFPTLESNSLTNVYGNDLEFVYPVKDQSSELLDSEDDDISAAPPRRICARWSKREDIFLTGAVMELYFGRHSLKPTKSESTRLKKLSGISGDIVWRKIHERYELACARHFIRTGTKSPMRTLKALQKRWKESASHRSKHNGDSGHNQTKTYLKLWLDVYNRDQILTGDAQSEVSSIES